MDWKILAKRAGRMLVAVLPALSAAAWKEFGGDISGLTLFGSISVAFALPLAGKVIRLLFPSTIPWLPF